MTSATSRVTQLPRLAAASAALAACLVVLGAANTAHAGIPAADVPSVTVRYGDLNLETAAGTQMLYARIAAAARQVCAVPSDVRDLAGLAAARTCEKEAIARAVREVNNPHLAAAYDARLVRS
jgi:UrcA family protein